MYILLKERFQAYLKENNPEIIESFTEATSLQSYINDQLELIKPKIKEYIEQGHPEYVIVALCLRDLTAPLKPSKANYLKNVLDDEFSQHYALFIKLGVLNYEIINLIEVCNPVFNEHDFNEQNQTDRFLGYAIIAMVHHYLLDFDHRPMITP